MASHQQPSLHDAANRATGSALGPADFLAYYELRLGQTLRPNANCEASATCVLHEDHNPSLSVNVDTGVWCCHAGCGGGDVFDFEKKLARCDFPEAKRRVFEAIGRDRQPAPPAEREIVETYDYTDEDGNLLSQVLRYQPKDFRQRRPDGHGGWTYNQSADADRARGATEGAAKLGVREDPHEKP